MKLFPRGTDCDLFSPDWRDNDFINRYGGSKESIKLMYAGRISREKDLDVLTKAFIEARNAFPGLELYFAGDGPYLGDLVNQLSGKGCYFCGELDCEDLSRAYASCDIFVFPSSTDTYGNSVLEAQASGLPAVVSDRGGGRRKKFRGAAGNNSAGQNRHCILKPRCGIPFSRHS